MGKSFFGGNFRVIGDHSTNLVRSVRPYLTPPRQFVTVWALALCGVLLIAAITLSTLLIIVGFRDRALAHAEREMKNSALLIARHLDQQFAALEHVQTSVVERIRSLGITSSEKYERAMS